MFDSWAVWKLKICAEPLTNNKTLHTTNSQLLLHNAELGFLLENDPTAVVS